MGNPYLCRHKKVKNMTAIALKHETEGYWNLIKDAGYEVKLVLIKKLSDSLRNAVTEKRSRRKTYTADDFAGMWSDEYFMDQQNRPRFLPFLNNLGAQGALYGAAPQIMLFTNCRDPQYLVFQVHFEQAEPDCASV